MSMGLGLSELLIILLSLGLPSGPIGKPAPANEMFRYLPAGSTLVASIDAGTIGPSIKNTFDKLLRQPFVTEVPPIQQALQQAKKQLENKLAEIRQMLGADPLKVLRYVSAGLVLSPPRYDFQGVIVFGGRIPQQTAVNVARMLGLVKVQRKGKLVYWLSQNRRKPGVAWLPSGTLLVGTDAQLQRIIAGRIPKPASGTLVYRMIQHHAKASLASVGFQPGAGMKAEALRELVGPFHLLFNNLAAAQMDMQYKGLSLTLFSGRGDVLQRYKLLLDGLGTWLTAGEHFIRGLVRIVDGGLSADEKLANKSVLKLLKQKKAILAWLATRIPRSVAKYRVELKKGRYARLLLKSQNPYWSSVTTGVGLLTLFLGTAKRGGSDKKVQSRTVRIKTAPVPVPRPAPKPVKKSP